MPMLFVNQLGKLSGTTVYDCYPLVKKKRSELEQHHFQKGYINRHVYRVVSWAMAWLPQQTVANEQRVTIIGCSTYSPNYDCVHYN